jgi:hypothetical protein
VSGTTVHDTINKTSTSTGISLFISEGFISGCKYTN